MAFSSDSFAPALQMFERVGQNLMQRFAEVLSAPELASFAGQDAERLAALQRQLLLVSSIRRSTINAASGSMPSRPEVPTTGWTARRSGAAAGGATGATGSNKFSDGERAARTRPGNSNYTAIEPAPGRYVKEKAS